MHYVRWKERHRRMMEALEESWHEGGKLPEDPGLRTSYGSLERAPIRIITLPLGKAINHGGMTRIADAYRIERVDLAREADRAVDFAGQRGSKSWQPWRWCNPEDAIREAKAEGLSTIALTLSDRSVDIACFTWEFPCAIVVGEEAGGIPAEIEELCDASVAIPLYGLVTSINVVTATAIALEYALRSYRTQRPDFQPARSASRRLLS